MKKDFFYRLNHPVHLRRSRQVKLASYTEGLISSVVCRAVLCLYRLKNRHHRRNGIMVGQEIKSIISYNSI
jgi:hypothetical protein